HAILRKNYRMRQLQLFNSSQLAQMRDRTASRNYSPERDEFRREHQRHRDWGLERRYARKRQHLLAGDSRPTPADHNGPPSPSRRPGPERSAAGERTATTRT